MLTNTMDQIEHSEEQKLLAFQVRSNSAIARYRLGKIKEAVVLDEKTLEYAAVALGDDHRETLAVQTRLGLGHLELHNERLALPLLRDSQYALKRQPVSKGIEVIIREYKQHQQVKVGEAMDPFPQP